MTIKTDAEIRVMKDGGKYLGEILQKLLDKTAPGIVPLEIEEYAQKLIKKVAGIPSFMKVPGYNWATCINTNDGVVHGIPGNDPFKEGDVVNIDIGLLYKGLHTDTGWTKALFLNPLPERITRFFNAGKKALKSGIAQAKDGNNVGDISYAIQKVLEESNYGIVKSLVGHGIGKNLHEPPQVPNILKMDVKKTPLLQAGMTIAIEPIYTEKLPDIIKKNDGWTIVTADGSLAGQFEHTILITKNEPIVLTVRI